MAGVESKVSPSALLIGLTAAAIALFASAAAWWRWERVETLAGGVPLPPGSEVVRIAEAEGGGDRYSALVRSPKAAERILEFYRREMNARGWRLVERSGLKAKYRGGGAVLRLFLHPHEKNTEFTLSMRR